MQLSSSSFMTLLPISILLLFSCEKDLEITGQHPNTSSSQQHISDSIIQDENNTPILQDKVLEINIQGIDDVEGNINLAIFNNKEDYESENNAYHAQNYAVDSQNVSIQVLNVPEGEYVIILFQDINQNGELDKSIFGYPKEPYGFSNNPGLTFGKPSFNNVKFTVSDQPAQTIGIELIKL